MPAQNRDRIAIRLAATAVPRAHPRGRGEQGVERIAGLPVQLIDRPYRRERLRTLRDLSRAGLIALGTQLLRQSLALGNEAGKRCLVQLLKRLLEVRHV